ncbi:MAG: hypothetical protein ABIR70_08340 [Bryobacteraceae bacterium]
MSWDIFVQDLPQSARSIDEIPEDFRPGLIGRKSDLISEITKVVPFADFSDRSWGRIDGPGFSIEVNLGIDEDVQHFAFHVRGDDIAAAVVVDILACLRLRALDPSSASGILDMNSDYTASMQKWRLYRASVMSR